MMMNKEKNFISAVVYVYNEGKNIYSFLEKINQELNNNFEKYEIICVNDASTDNSVAEIKRFSTTVKANAMISILNMSFYQGMELSMNAGVDVSIGDFVYEFDTADLIYPLEMLMMVYHKSLQGYDIVAAAPSKGVRTVSKLFYSIFNKASGTQNFLTTESFRIISRRGINRAHAISRTTPYRKAVYANCGLKSAVLTFDNAASPAKPDRNTIRMQKEIAVDALVLYTDLGYRFSTGFSALMMLITVLIGIYTVCIYIAKKPVAGWTTTMLFLSFAFFGLFTILTILIKYVSIVLKLNFNRQKYLIESIEKLTDGK